MTWVDGMHFKCFNNEHEINIDATIDHGGNNKGPSPKMILLDAMMSCTAIDTLTILNKMRQSVEGFEMEIEGIKNKSYPIHFKEVKLTFKLTGKLDHNKVLKAISSSLTKYCGVNYMISKVCKINYDIFINLELIHSDFAKFKTPID